MAEDARVARGPHDKHAVHARIVQRLKDQAEDVVRLVAGLSEEETARRTVPDKWSLKELVCHLDRIQEVFEGRVEAMLGGENPTLPAYEPDGDPQFAARVKQPTADTLADFLARREALAERLADLAPPQWHRVGRHPEYANYDVHFCVEYLAHHEAHHLYQMYQRRSPLGPIPH